MANSIETITRADVDIHEDILNVFTTYGPIMHDRHRVHVDVVDGHVKISGHVKSRVTHRFVVNTTPTVRGVKSVDTSELYSDESIRLDSGHVIPYGVFVNVEYGAVILSGKSPEGVAVEELVKKIASIRGVHRVLTLFIN